MEDNFVYAFDYCPCIHESAWATISLHRTENGAIKAMNEHKERKEKEYNLIYTELDDSEIYGTFGEMEDWTIKKIQILD